MSASAVGAIHPAPHRRSSSFFLPMLLMRNPKREALKSLYYFCRSVDDAVDEAPSPQQAKQNLDYWHRELENCYTGKHAPDNPISAAMARSIAQYQLPRQPFEDLFSGMAFDCQPEVNIETEAQLERYCYCVAGTVGLLALPIFGETSNNAQAFARQLGQALQCTNILRDVDSDHQHHRNYLPSEWQNEARQRLIEKAETSFRQVEALQTQLPTRPLLPALLMRDIYAWKLHRLKHRKPPKPLPFRLYLTLLANTYRYRFG